MTINAGIFILVVVLAVGLGLAIGWLVASSRSAVVAERVRGELDEVRRELTATHDELLISQGTIQRLEVENEELLARAEDDANAMAALAPISRKIHEVDHYIREFEKKNAQDFTRINELLNQDANMTLRLTQTAESLNSAMRNSSARGSWGEVQLRRIIEAAGMMERVDFDVQTASSTFAGHGAGDERKNVARPDAIIHLPGDGHICIDSKVPMSSYLAAHDISATDHERATERARLLDDHARAVKSHVTALKKRNYPGDFPDSPQITIMFLPNESLLSQALDSDPTLLDNALAQGIVPATPASLLAVLRSVGSVWRSASATDEAREIVSAGRELVERLVVFVGHMNKLGSSISGSVKAYNAALGSLESRVLPTYRKFDAFADSTSGLAIARSAVDGERGQLREFTSAELSSIGSHDQADRSQLGG